MRHHSMNVDKDGKTFAKLRNYVNELIVCVRVYGISGDLKVSIKYVEPKILHDFAHCFSIISSRKQCTSFTIQTVGTNSLGISIRQRWYISILLWSIKYNSNGGWDNCMENPYSCIKWKRLNGNAIIVRLYHTKRAHTHTIVQIMQSERVEALNCSCIATHFLYVFNLFRNDK